MIETIRHYSEKLIDSHGNHVEAVLVEDLQMILDGLVSPIKLEWRELDGNFGKSYIAPIPRVHSCYAVWVDKETGKTKSSGLDRSHSTHNSVEDAKRYCQEDFNNIVIGLLDAKY